MSWMDQLQPASFRGVPFAILSSESRFGRRVAVHEYPYRDKPWVEDLGRSARKIGLTGFLVSNSLIYGGGDVVAQREILVDACETEGPGDLIHPTLGQLKVSLAEGGLGIVEKWDQGRYFEISFSFIESGDRLFPTLVTSTQDAVTAAADTTDAAASTDFTAGVIMPLQTGSLTVGQVIGMANSWVKQVNRMMRDATNLVSLVNRLPGNLGRFIGLGALIDPTGTIASLIALGAQSRALVTNAANLLNAAAGNFSRGTVGSFASAAQAHVAALRTTVPNPSDAIRLLSNLAGDTTNAPAKSPVGDLFRRAAVVSLARATADYQPISSDDAARALKTVTGLLDNEITTAGDQGDDATYVALQVLRQAVIQDLTSRSSGLSSVETFSFNASLPALVLAERLYQDPGRADELVQEANPVHPAFMPTRFKGLSS